LRRKTAIRLASKSGLRAIVVNSGASVVVLALVRYDDVATDAPAAGKRTAVADIGGDATECRGRCGEADCERTRFI
jgi:hypothetical protein